MAARYEVFAEFKGPSLFPAGPSSFGAFDDAYEAMMALKAAKRKYRKQADDLEFIVYEYDA
jgi:hypothetical protein